MRVFILTLALSWASTAPAVPKTVESLCGALLLTRPSPIIADQGEIKRYVGELTREGQFEPDEAASLVTDLDRADQMTVALAIKGDAEIKAYLNDLQATLDEFDQLGEGAYRNLRPSRTSLALTVAKGLGVTVLGQGAAIGLHHGPVGVSLGLLSVIYLYRQFVRGGFGYLKFYAKISDRLGRRRTGDLALDWFDEALTRDKGETVAYRMGVAVDEEYLNALLAANGPRELPLKELGRALLRRRAMQTPLTAEVSIHQAFFQDHEDGRNVLLSIIRVRRVRPKATPPRGRWLPNALTLGNKLRAAAAAVAVPTSR